MIFSGFPVGAFETNCYIIGCEETKEGQLWTGFEAEKF